MAIYSYPIPTKNLCLTCGLACYDEYVKCTKCDFKSHKVCLLNAYKLNETYYPDEQFMCSRIKYLITHNSHERFIKLKNLRPSKRFFKPAINKYKVNKGIRYTPLAQKCDDCGDEVDVYQNNHKILRCKAYGDPRFGDIGCCRTLPKNKRNLKSDSLVQFLSDVDKYNIPERSDTESQNFCDVFCKNETLYYLADTWFVDLEQFFPEPDVVDDVSSPVKSRIRTRQMTRSQVDFGSDLEMTPQRLTKYRNLALTDDPSESSHGNFAVLINLVCLSWKKLRIVLCLIEKQHYVMQLIITNRSANLLIMM